MTEQTKPIVVTPEILALSERLAKIFMPHAAKHQLGYFKKTPDQRSAQLAHYTTAEAALNIIKSKRFWMRNTICRALGERESPRSAINVARLRSKPRSRRNCPKRTVRLASILRAGDYFQPGRVLIRVRGAQRCRQCHQKRRVRLRVPAGSPTPRPRRNSFQNAACRSCLPKA